MNKKEIEILKEKLEENKKSLEDMLSNFAEKDNVPKGDWETKYPKFTSDDDGVADEIEEYSSLVPTEHALEIKLKNIDDALERIEKGEYGKCENCNKDIPYEKLVITPEKKTCIDC